MEPEVKILSLGDRKTDSLEIRFAGRVPFLCRYLSFKQMKPFRACEDGNWLSNLELYIETGHDESAIRFEAWMSKVAFAIKQKLTLRTEVACEIELIGTGEKYRVLCLPMSFRHTHGFKGEYTMEIRMTVLDWEQVIESERTTYVDHHPV